MDITFTATQCELKKLWNNLVSGKRGKQYKKEHVARTNAEC